MIRDCGYVQCGWPVISSFLVSFPFLVQIAHGALLMDDGHMGIRVNITVEEKST